LTGSVTPESAGRGRRRLLLGLLALVVVVLAVLGVVLLNSDDDSSTADGSSVSAAANSTATAAAATTPVPAGTATVPSTSPSSAPATGATDGGEDLPPALPAVPLDQTAAVGNGVTASVVSIDEIQGHAVGPGNVDGPALRITVRLDNGTSDGVLLDGVSVNLAYGPDRTPASLIDDSSRRPFTGILSPGDSAEGTYVFTVPADSRDQLSLEVGYQAGAPVLVFTGAASDR
jgi:hypothetical protein